MQPLTQHPLSAAFPSMSEADYLTLMDNINDYGQREPIIVFDGMVLDGWHRHRACMQIGLEPRVIPFAADDPVAFVASMNLHRRHLTGTQRAAAVVACRSWVLSGVNQHTKTAGGEATSPPQKTTAQMASEAKVSERTIEHAKAAHQAGLGDAMKDGAMTAEEAFKVARDTTAKTLKPKVSAATTRAATGSSTTPRSATAAEKLAAQNAEDAHGDSDLGMLVDELQAEVKSLQAQVGAAMADDAKAEAMKYQRIASIAQTRQNELMATVNDREAELKKVMKALRRCGAAVGEEDPYKVPAAVEAAMRNAAVLEPA